MKNIPEFPGGGLLGHLDRFRHDRPQLLVDIHRACGGLGRARLANRAVLFAYDPQIVHQLLVTDGAKLHKSPGLRVFAKPLLGDGLLRAEGEAWRRRRKLVAQLFAKGRVGQFAEVMTACCDRVVDSWRDGQEIDVVHEMTRVTLDIVSQTLFGVAEREAVAEVGAAMAHAQASLNRRLSSAVPLPLSIPTPANRALHRALNVLDARVHDIIRRRRAQPDGGGDGEDVLTRLLQARDEAGERLSDTQIRDEVMNLYVAGHETTAATLSWTLHLLGRHGPAYEKVLAASRALAHPPGAADRAALGVVERSVQEATRLYPAAYFFGRTAQEPLEIAGHPVPVGTTVYMSPYVMHRREDLWPDPERFDPARFFGGAQSRPKYHYMPFGGGARVCVGVHFSMLEAVLCLATICRRVRLEPVGDGAVALNAQITLSPARLRMRVRC